MIIHRHACAKRKGYRIIEASLDKEDHRAKIKISYSPFCLRQSPPIIVCEEFWIRKKAAWHYEKWSDELGTLCWIHPEEWKLAQSDFLKRDKLVIEEGAAWLINRVRSLLEKHWQGYQLGIENWLPEWTEWQHGRIGDEQFNSEIMQYGTPMNWSKKSNL